MNVLDVNSLRHLRFRAVAIVGLAERAFQLRRDPTRSCSTTSARRSTPRPGSDTATRSRRRPRAAAVRAATYAADERLLASYPRKGNAEGRPRLPSRFFRALAEAAVGHRVPAQEVDDLPDGLYRRARGSRIGAGELDVALSAEEYDRTLLEHDLASLGKGFERVEPRFARALEARSARGSSKLTEFDGALGPEARELLKQAFDPAAASARRCSRARTARRA